jgi:hypothetical protein
MALASAAQAEPNSTRLDLQSHTRPVVITGLFHGFFLIAISVSQRV